MRLDNPDEFNMIEIMPETARCYRDTILPVSMDIIYTRKNVAVVHIDGEKLYLNYSYWAHCSSPS